MTNKRIHSTIQIFSAFMLGGLLPLGFAPFNWWWLSILSVGCFPLILKNNTGFFKGWAYGTGVFTVGISWVFISLYNYSKAGIIGSSLATLTLSITLGLFFALLGKIHQKCLHSTQNAILSAGLWVGFEWIRSWAFTGFPWLYLGYTALESPLINNWIPIVGIYGTSFILGLWSILFIQLLISLFTSSWQPKHIFNPKINSAITITFLLSIPLSNIMLDNIHWTKETSQTLNIALIQGNIDQLDKWNPVKAPLIAHHYLEMTKLAVAENADIIIWPEAALPTLYSQGQDILEQARSILTSAQETPSYSNPTFGPTLITGLLTDNQTYQRPNRQEIPSKEQQPKIRNSVLSINSNPAEDTFYHKQRLVPFGEYLPFADQVITVFPFLDTFRHGITAGNKNQKPIQSHNWLIQPLICYEIAFPGLAFQQMHISTHNTNTTTLVDAIVTISNDGWFGLSHGPSQHFQMAQYRAKEFGRPVIRATNTGITGVIDTHGTSLNLLPRQKQGTLYYTLHKQSGTTPYSNYGPKGVLFTLLSIVFCSIIFKMAQEKKIQPESQ